MLLDKITDLEGNERNDSLSFKINEISLDLRNELSKVWGEFKKKVDQDFLDQMINTLKTCTEIEFEH